MRIKFQTEKVMMVTVMMRMGRGRPVSITRQVTEAAYKDVASAFEGLYPSHVPHESAKKPA